MCRQAYKSAYSHYDLIIDCKLG